MKKGTKRASTKMQQTTKEDRERGKQRVKSL